MDISGRVPLCNSQYEHMFGTMRLPRPGMDELVHHPMSRYARPRHVAVPSPCTTGRTRAMCVYARACGPSHYPKFRVYTGAGTSSWSGTNGSTASRFSTLNASRA